MTLRLDKSTWQRVRFGDVVDRSREQVDPRGGRIERYVAGGHFADAAVEVTRFGTPDDGGMGSTFTYAFHPGHVLYVSASWYLRKVGVATFDGVVADKTYVLEARDNKVLDQRFLPWILLSDELHAYAAAQSTGSMNARLLWSTLAAFEFSLPPLWEQKKIADLLWGIEAHNASLAALSPAIETAYDTWLEDRLANASRQPLAEVLNLLHGRPVPSSLYGKGDFALLRPGDMKPDGSVQWTRSSVGIPREFVERYEQWILEPGDVVINMTAQSLEERFLGRVCKMHDRAFLNQRIGRLSSNGPVTMDFAYIALRSSQFSKWVAQRSEGSKVKHMHWRHIADYPLPVPSTSDQEAIVNEAAAWSDASLGASLEIGRLRDLRASVLGELFAGN